MQCSPTDTAYKDHRQLSYTKAPPSLTTVNTCSRQSSV